MFSFNHTTYIIQTGWTYRRLIYTQKKKVKRKERKENLCPSCDMVTRKRQTQAYPFSFTCKGKPMLWLRLVRDQVNQQYKKRSNTPRGPSVPMDRLSLRQGYHRRYPMRVQARQTVHQKQQNHRRKQQVQFDLAEKIFDLGFVVYVPWETKYQDKDDEEEPELYGYGRVLLTVVVAIRWIKQSHLVISTGCLVFVVIFTGEEGEGWFIAGVFFLIEIVFVNEGGSWRSRCWFI